MRWLAWWGITIAMSSGVSRCRPRRIVDALGHAGDGELEDRVAVLLEKMLPAVTVSRARRMQAAPSRHHQVVAAAAVHQVIEVEGAETGLGRLEQHRARAIAEENGGGPVERIDDRRS